MIKWRWHYVLSVGYQQYRIDAGGLCYSINCAPKPDSFAYDGKGPFHPGRSWWFQLLKPFSSLFSILMFIKSSFPFHASIFILFLCWEIMWGFLFAWFFFLTIEHCIDTLDGERGSIHQKCEAENNLSAWALHLQEIISWTTTVFVNSFMPEIMFFIFFLLHFYIFPDPHLFSWVWC